MGILPESKVKIKLITPMCSHTDKNMAEFRFTELKHAMRFWWRAVNSFSDSMELKKKERALFGGPNNKSPLLFKPKFKSPLIAKNITLKVVKKPTVQALVDEEIEFRISAKYNKIEDYLLLLELSSYLGGLGQRSRKGYGGFKVINEKLNISNAEELSWRIYEVIRKISNQASSYRYDADKNKITSTKKLDTKYAMVSEIIVGPEIDGKTYNADRFLDTVAKLVAEWKMCDGLEPYIFVSCYMLENENIIPIITGFNYACRNWHGKRINKQKSSGFNSLNKR